MTIERSRWVEITDADPEHSTRYVERFRTMDAEGRDLAGEARLVDAMVPRGARILDAGCGPGRVGGYLHGLGHDVIGVDVDPVLIEAAQLDHPGPTWIVADLAVFDLADLNRADLNRADFDRAEFDGADIAGDGFDVIVSAGNVMTFLAPSTRRAVLERLREHLSDSGRIVIGFGGDRDYPFDDFFADVAATGLEIELRLATWDLRPFTAQSDFLVAVLRRQ